MQYKGKQIIYVQQPNGRAIEKGELKGWTATGLMEVKLVGRKSMLFTRTGEHVVEKDTPEVLQGFKIVTEKEWRAYKKWWNDISNHMRSDPLGTY